MDLTCPCGHKPELYIIEQKKDCLWIMTLRCSLCGREARTGMLLGSLDPLDHEEIRVASGKCGYDLRHEWLAGTDAVDSD